MASTGWIPGRRSTPINSNFDRLEHFSSCGGHADHNMLIHGFTSSGDSGVHSLSTVQTDIAKQMGEFLLDF
ncbi:uncharacterized protein N7529_007151 [Penicillium soppii]|uniref:uncharacterized protein n=1 Tax=Penicillium soppii TaxID=69789 RepID=UPI00254802E7|nr:uncharacterized protein N7529_007151 [Penicillium soppii]KAJ5865235.1 hypothetical protein N7529_007151 [Penicillium soppii]